MHASETIVVLKVGPSIRGEATGSSVTHQRHAARRDHDHRVPNSRYEPARAVRRGVKEEGEHRQLEEQRLPKHLRAQLEGKRRQLGVRYRKGETPPSRPVSRPWPQMTADEY